MHLRWTLVAAFALVAAGCAGPTQPSDPSGSSEAPAPVEPATPPPKTPPPAPAAPSQPSRAASPGITPDGFVSEWSDPTFEGRAFATGSLQVEDAACHAHVALTSQGGESGTSLALAIVRVRDTGEMTNASWTVSTYGPARLHRDGQEYVPPPDEGLPGTFNLSLGFEAFTGRFEFLVAANDVGAVEDAGDTPRFAIAVRCDGTVLGADLWGSRTGEILDDDDLDGGTTLRLLSAGASSGSGAQVEAGGPRTMVWGGDGRGRGTLRIDAAGVAQECSLRPAPPAQPAGGVADVFAKEYGFCRVDGPPGTVEVGLERASPDGRLWVVVAPMTQIPTLAGLAALPAVPAGP